MASDAAPPSEAPSGRLGRDDDVLGARIEPSTNEMARARRTILAGLFPEEPTPAVDERYVLGPAIGHGGLGRVHRAHDRHLGRDVAIKFLRGRPAVSAELEREARALAQLQHPNIVAVYDVSTGAEEPYLTMELVDGMTLARWLPEHASDRARVLAIFEQAARGLGAAHEVGIVHRDFKPANVMVGNDGRVRVVDFGLARSFHALEAAVTEDDRSSPGGEVSRVEGTRPYMAPEQLDGRVSAASDQFAFCTSLYEALCSERPWSEAWRGLSTPEEEAALEGALRRASVPRWLQRVVMRGLRREPGERFGSMQALLSDFRPGRSRWWPAVALGLGAAGLLGAGLYPSDDPCVDRGQAAARVEDRAQQVASTLADGGADLVEHARAYAQAWNALDAQACRDRAAGSISGALHDLRARCLRRSLDKADYLLEQLGSASETARALVSSMDVDPCADDDALLLGRPEPESDPAQHERIIAAIDRAHVELSLGRQREYRQTLERAHDELGAAGSAPRAQAWLVAHLGHAWVQEGESERAEQLVLPVLLEAQQHPAWIREVGDLRTVLAQALMLQPNRLGEARMLAMEAAAALATLDDAGPYELAARSVLATATAQLGEPHEALELVEEALWVARRAWEEPSRAWFDLPINTAQLLAVRGGILLGMSRSEDAEQDYIEALGLLEQEGRELMLTAQLLNNLAVIDKRAGRSEQAIARIQRAAAVKTRLGNHQAAALTLKNAGNIHMAEGRVDAALAVYDRALEQLPTGASAAEIQLRYARALGYQSQRRWPEARADLQRARELAASALDPSDPLHYVIDIVLGQVLVEQGALVEARRYLQHARTLETPRTAPGDRAELLVALSRTWLEEDLQHGAALAREAMAAAEASQRAELVAAAAEQLTAASG